MYIGLYTVCAFPAPTLSPHHQVLVGSISGDNTIPTSYLAHIATSGRLECLPGEVCGGGMVWFRCEWGYVWITCSMLGKMYNVRKVKCVFACVGLRFNILRWYVGFGCNLLRLGLYAWNSYTGIMSPQLPCCSFRAEHSKLKSPEAAALGIAKTVAYWCQNLHSYFSRYSLIDSWDRCCYLEESYIIHTLVTCLFLVWLNLLWTLHVFLHVNAFGS